MLGSKHNLLKLKIMYKIEKHPVLPIPKEDIVEFAFEGKVIKGQKGITMAAALHRHGFRINNQRRIVRNILLHCGFVNSGAC